MRVTVLVRARSRGASWSASWSARTRPPVAAARRSSGSRAAASSTVSEVSRATTSSRASGTVARRRVQVERLGELRHVEPDRVGADRQRGRGPFERPGLAGDGGRSGTTATASPARRAVEARIDLEHAGGDQEVGADAGDPSLIRAWIRTSSPSRDPRLERAEPDEARCPRSACPTPPSAPPGPRSGGGRRRRRGAASARCRRCRPRGPCPVRTAARRSRRPMSSSSPPVAASTVAPGLARPARTQGSRGRPAQIGRFWSGSAASWSIGQAAVSRPAVVGSERDAGGKAGCAGSIADGSTGTGCGSSDRQELADRLLAQRARPRTSGRGSGPASRRARRRRIRAGPRSPA